MGEGRVRMGVSGGGGEVGDGGAVPTGRRGRW